ncbi:MAG: hypothetical protein SGPRY_011942 [Prymnesium sp.]
MPLCLHGPNEHAKKAGGDKINNEWQSTSLAAFPPDLNFALAEACVGLARGHDPAGPPRISSRLSRPASASEERAEQRPPPIAMQSAPQLPMLPHVYNEPTGEHSERRLVLPHDAPQDELPAEPVQAILAIQGESERADASTPASSRHAIAAPSSVFSPGGTALDVYEEFNAGGAPPQPSSQRESAATRRERNYNPSMRTPVATRSRTRTEQGIAHLCGSGLTVLVKQPPLSPSSYATLIGKRKSSTDPANHREAMIDNEDGWRAAEFKELRAPRRNESCGRSLTPATYPEEGDLYE